MDEILKNIDIEKRDRIINSALEEFSRNRYNKASTNNIVKGANISKGLLFHYFENKKVLYEYLKKFAIEALIEAINEKIDWNETDFFSRIKQVAIIKGELGNRYPYIYDFILEMFEGKSMNELNEYREKIAPGLLEQIYVKNIDFSKFREGIDMQRTMSIIRWTIEKFGEETFNRISKTKEHINYHEFEDEFEKYITILKEAFYK